MEIKVEGDKVMAVHLLLQSIFVKNKCITLENIPDCLDFIRISNFINSSGIGKVEIDSENRQAKISCSSIPENLTPLNTVSRSSIGLISSSLITNKKITFCSPGGCRFSERPIDAHLNLLKQFGNVIQSDSEHFIALKNNVTPDRISCNCYAQATSSIGVFFNILLTAYVFSNEIVIFGASKEPVIKQLLMFLKGTTNRTFIEDGNRIIIPTVNKVIVRDCKFKIKPDMTMAISYILANFDKLKKVSFVGVKKENFSNAQLVFLKKIGISIFDTDNGIKCTPDTFYSKPEEMILRFGQTPDISTDLAPVIASFLSEKEIKSILVDYTYYERYSHVRLLNDRGLNIKVLDKGIIQTNLISRNKDFTFPSKISAPDIRAGMAGILAFMLNKDETSIVIGNFEQICRGYGNIKNMLEKAGIVYEEFV